MLRRTLTAATVTAVLVMGTAACGSDEPKPTPTKSPSASTTPTRPVWESKHTEAEIADYKAALTHWNDYERESAPIWAEGKVTDEAERIFEHYWATRLFMTTRLKDYEAINAQDLGGARVLWSKPRVLKPGVAYIRQCVDHSEGQFKVDGELQPTAKEPYLREIHLAKNAERGWLIYGVKDASTRWLKPCKG